MVEELLETLIDRGFLLLDNGGWDLLGELPIDFDVPIPFRPCSRPGSICSTPPRRMRCKRLR